eukprot:TRINITY_DN17221_c0_g1_i1.p1 TRINITY_DN17221_c0_g1~~TRINITY_DN17221_c0_g1_i1.p1  ORF type:complete len:418 (-),score=87.89 TRINITY_DN17221_c0_g1_i1:304-1557(-)
MPVAITVCVVEAQDLASTPTFCRVNGGLLKKPVKTKVAKTYNPRWNQSFQMDILSPQTSVLTVEVFEKDRFGKGDQVGFINLSLAELSESNSIDRWFVLTRKRSTDRVSGQLRLKVDLGSSPSAAGYLAPPDLNAPAVEVPEARGASPSFIASPRATPSPSFGGASPLVGGSPNMGRGSPYASPAAIPPPAGGGFTAPRAPTRAAASDLCKPAKAGIRRYGLQDGDHNKDPTEQAKIYESELKDLKDMLHVKFKEKKAAEKMVGMATGEMKTNAEKEVSNIQDDIEALKENKKEITEGMEEAGTPAYEDSYYEGGEMSSYNGYGDNSYNERSYSVGGYDDGYGAQPVATPPPPSGPPPSQGAQAQVDFDYAKDQDHELDLVAGEMLTVMEMDNPEWWYGINENGGEGYFPKSYVTLL